MKPVIIIAIAFVLLIPIPVFAQTDNITSKHWFITSYENGCSVDNQKSLEFYEKLTPQYLSKYDIHGSQDTGKCVRGIDVANNLEDFSSALTNYDLPIIILDGFKGLDYALTTDAFGHYIFQDNQDVIIFASLSPFVESDSGAWTLSHELSHFALHEKEYSQSVFIDWVHQKQTEANTCLKNDLSLNNCPDLWTTVKSPLGKNIKMMKIYTSDSESTSANNIETTSQTVPEIKLIQSNQDLYTLASECTSLSLNREYKKAIQVCKDLYNQADPSHVTYGSALLGLSQSYEKLRDYDNAIFYREKLVELKPNDYSTLLSACSLHIEAGNYQEAKSYGMKAQKINADDYLLDLLCLDRLSSISTKSQVFDIKPIISNGFITKYEMNSYQNKLHLSVTMDSNKSGDAQIVLPRLLLDSKSSDNDIPFKVTVGGKSVTVNEIVTNDLERVIKFPVSSTTSTIIITGSESYPNAVVVPEFGSIAMLILVTSIIAVIVSTRKFQVIK